MKIKNYIVSLISVCSLASCSLLGPIDELKPEYVLDDETIITDASSAEAAVGGIYASWRKYAGIYNAMFVRTGVLANSNVNGANKFQNGDIKDDNYTVSETYTALYYVINQANSVIAALGRSELSGVTEEMRNNYIHEAKFNRAMAHFMLLRLYGEFWDMDSQYGIVLYDTPVRDNVPKARASVKECYQLIIDDLQAASSLPVQQSTNGPAMYLASSLSAKGLLAKVYLTQGDYAQAFTLSGEVIEEAQVAGIQLEEEYASIFRSFNNSELLFYPYTMNSLQKVQSSWYDWQQGAGKALKELAQNYPDDTRYVWAFNQGAGLYKMSKYQMDDQADNVPGNSLYMLRLGELYYIRAEAALRQPTPSYQEARKALHPVLKRAGFADNYLEGIAENQLLMEIFNQKYLELFGENFEDWFDMVRYHQLDGTDWLAIGYMGFRGKLILPIPRMALSGNDLLIQNP